MRPGARLQDGHGGAAGSEVLCVLADAHTGQVYGVASRALIGRLPVEAAKGLLLGGVYQTAELHLQAGEEIGH